MNCVCIIHLLLHLQDFLHRWHNRLGPSESHGNVWTPTWSQRQIESSDVLLWRWCLSVSVGVNLQLWCPDVQQVFYPLRSCRVVTASEHPSLPGRSSMLPLSGCRSRRTSASVRDTGRKHLDGTQRGGWHSCSHTPKQLPLNTEQDSRWDLSY